MTLHACSMEWHSPENSPMSALISSACGSLGSQKAEWRRCSLQSQIGFYKLRSRPTLTQLEHHHGGYFFINRKWKCKDLHLSVHHHPFVSLIIPRFNKWLTGVIKTGSQYRFTVKSCIEGMKNKEKNVVDLNLSGKYCTTVYRITFSITYR